MALHNGIDPVTGTRLVRPTEDQDSCYGDIVAALTGNSTTSSG